MKIIISALYFTSVIALMFIAAAVWVLVGIVNVIYSLFSGWERVK